MKKNKKKIAEPKEECVHCAEFFRRFRCGKYVGEGECDCPKCQGYCKCQK